MCKILWPALMLLSLGLNVSFGTMWAIRALPQHLQEETPAPPVPAEVRTHLLDFQRSSEPVCRRVSVLRDDLIDLVAAPEPDRKAIEAKQEEIALEQRRMQDLTIEHLFACKESLAPEKRAEFFGKLRSTACCLGHGPGTSPCGGRTDERCGPTGP